MRARLSTISPASGNFKVTFNLKNGRSQVAFISSATYRYMNLEIREIVSPAYRSAAPFTAEVANRLLADNNDKKLGAWVMQKEKDGYYALFVTKIPADSSDESLHQRAAADARSGRRDGEGADGQGRILVWRPETSCLISGHSERSEESHTQRAGNGLRCEMLRRSALISRPKGCAQPERAAYCARHDAG